MITAHVPPVVYFFDGNSGLFEEDIALRADKIVLDSYGVRRIELWLLLGCPLFTKPGLKTALISVIY